MSTSVDILAAPTSDSTLVVCRQTIAHHSKSFALAARVLPPASRDQAAIVYTFCRRVDDAIDLAPADERADALARLRAELRSIYAGERQRDPVLAAFQQVVVEARIPEVYPTELLAGMAMDVERVRYATMDELLRYCYRVASTVGLMMSHVMGVRSEGAMRNAAHLGIAMQISNICRDVQEDWADGRLYLPQDLLETHGAGWLRNALGRPLPPDAVLPVGNAVRELLDRAEVFYRSGDRGLASLPWRCAFAVRTARLVYARIGDRIRRQNCDVTAGRAFVPGWLKGLLLLRSAAAAVAELPFRAVRRRAVLRIPASVTEFPHDVLPV